MTYQEELISYRGGENGFLPVIFVVGRGAGRTITSSSVEFDAALSPGVELRSISLPRYMDDDACDCCDVRRCGSPVSSARLASSVRIACAMRSFT